MANDLYPLYARCMGNAFSWQRSLYESTTRLLLEAARWVLEQRMVFGGSSLVYSQPFSRVACDFYDEKCIMVKQHGLREGFSCINGGNIFMDIVLKDRIGHVSAASMPIYLLKSSGSGGLLHGRSPPPGGGGTLFRGLRERPQKHVGSWVAFWCQNVCKTVPMVD